MKYLYIAALIFLTSCGQENINSTNKETTRLDSTSSKIETAPESEAVKLTDKTVKFLWRINKYDEALKDTFYSIIINEEFCKTITDPERAALGYVATFIGNECNWDGEYTEERSNLKCKILTALNLGYQCSDKHLGFLRRMFKNDPKVLEELKKDNCPTTPDGATSQDTFEEITLSVKGNEILVFFKANGVNTQEGESWRWTETDHFQFEKDNIRLIKKDESKVEHEQLDIGE